MLMTPARRVALAIVVPVALVTIGWSAFGLIASLGSDQFSFSAPLTAAGGTLTADFPGSDVTIRPGVAAQVDGIASYSLVRPQLTVTDGAVSYHCQVPTGTCGLTSTLTVPASATSVDVSTGGGGLTVDSGVTANVTLSSSSGDIKADGLTGTASLESGGGNVNAAGITAGRVTVNSDSGNVSLGFTEAPGDVLVNSGGGGVSIVLPPGRYDFRVNADGGTVSTPASDPGARDVITVNSDSGDVTVSE